MIEITMLGIGGNGIITIADLLANIANQYDKYISIYTNYGSQMRGGDVIATVKIDDNEIINPKYSSANIFIIIDDTYLEKYKFLIDNNTVIINNKSNIMALGEALKFIEYTNYEVIENVFKKRFNNQKIFESNFNIIKKYIDKL